MSDRIDDVRKHLTDLIAAIRLCLTNRLVLPALMLMYAGIDIAGWVAAENADGSVRERFTAWAAKYLVVRERMKATALDIYGARCGLLHTLTAKSDLSRKGDARYLMYAWGVGRAEVYDRLITTTGFDDRYVAVQVEDLVDAFEAGLSEFFSELNADQGKRSKAAERATSFFQAVCPQQAEEFTAWCEQALRARNT